MRARTALTSLALVLSLAACGDDESPTLALDAGPSGIDAGTTPEVDAGSEPEVDAGPAPMDAGAPLDAGARSDGSILPPSDAGGDELFGDAGALGPPAWVPIDVLTEGTCDALEACGGDEVGTWDVSGGCVEVPVPEDLMRCPGAAFTRAEGRARGRVTFTGTTAVRLGQSEVEVEVFLPSLCASFIGGCAALETMIRMATPDSACVTEGTGDCRCVVRQASTIDESGAYTIEGDSIVAPPKRWDYCVEGSTLTYEDVSETGEREPGTLELTRR